MSRSLPAFDAVQPGGEPPAWAVGPISRTDIVRYQGASGDFNPVHHDEGFARASGFDAPLGVGMLTAGLMTTWATRWLGAERVRSTRVRWKKPVFPGTTVTFSGTVASRDAEAARVDLELQGVDDAGDVVVLGWMTFDLSEGA
ncbi:MAG: MaoC family dehydratase [Alphaproteobacteria bacterium]|nr:MaoC family dehydratase [Alphaproteobacteria bacterium]